MLPDQFLISEGVDVQLIASHLLGLCSLGGLEVDNGYFVCFEAADEIDPAIDHDTVAKVDLDLFLGVHRVGEFGTVGGEVSLDCLLG